MRVGTPSGAAVVGAAFLGRICPDLCGESLDVTEAVRRVDIVARLLATDDRYVEEVAR